jgi:FkbH-like protein
LKSALVGAGWESRLKLEIWEADYDQIQNQIFDENSPLYGAKCDALVLFFSAEKLWQRFNKTDVTSRANFANQFISDLEEMFAFFTARSSAKIIFYNLAEFDDGVFGNLANRVPASYLYQIRSLNYQLMLITQKWSALFIIDLNAIQSQIGRERFHAPNIYVSADMSLSLDGTALVAEQTVRHISSLRGRSKKCLILDLDNTVWGGIVGDDGYAHLQIGSLGIGKAFTKVQMWAKQLQQRGIILAVCSKNYENVAKEPFEKHPEMILRLSDIAVFVANWENKADNIRHIQRVLNIGFDSMVFLDDNPFERNLVKMSLPEVEVPELPEDPALYAEFLFSQNLFDTVSHSTLDIQRTEQYQAEAKRVTLQTNFTNEHEYLKSLDMICELSSASTYHIPRIAQLSQRSNQFNLRTVRLTEADLERMNQDRNFEVIGFSLADRFGEYGLVCVVILKAVSEQEAFIENWFMSCRVLKRGLENFTMNVIMEIARQRGWTKISGEYLPTSKNQMVAQHYAGLGFSELGSHSMISVNDFEERETLIKKK